MRLAGEMKRADSEWIGHSYQILKRLGYGGDGTVYLVRHVLTEQLRAAKKMKANVWKRRMHELDMMKRLAHPAFPKILDVAEEQGELWLIMEYLGGQTLAEMEAGRMNAALFFSVARQLADALVYLHTRKVPVLHLDIKPSNIILQPEGRLVLIDFGAAMRADPKEGGSARFGTPGFAAPEQRIPDVALDVRADFYGYGAVLYYCLFGCAPDHKMISGRKHVPPNAGWKRMALPLLRRCLQEDREKRFRDTRRLYRSVCGLEKRYYVHMQMRKAGIAALFLLAAVLFATASLGGERRTGTATAAPKAYEALLEQAGSLGFEQAVTCYEQAINLCPEDGAWCEEFLDRIEADYSFDAEEESALKKLIYMVPLGQSSTECELMEKNAPGYGELAYRIGLAYWHFYEETGGRSAAARWFSRAAASLRQSSMTDREKDHPAYIYARISSYYETLGKQGMDGSVQADLGVYWRDLTELWSLEKSNQTDSVIQCEIAQEILSILILQTHELIKTGEKIEQMKGMLESIRCFLETAEGAEEAVEKCREQYEAASESVERAIVNERRKEFEE